MRRKRTTFAIVLMLTVSSSVSAEGAQEFTEEELSVADFWRQMGPVLMEQGMGAYAIRYHEDFRHWDILGNGGFGGKQGVVDS